MTTTSLQPGEIDRHLRMMRVTTLAMAVTVPAAAVVMLLVPSWEGLASPLVVTLVASAAALWIGFTANRDAQARIDRAKRAYAVHGEETRLLRDHRLINLAVLARLAVMVAAAAVAGVWGVSAVAAWGILALAAMMMALTWPTADKTHTLIQRAREQRGR